MRDNTIAGEVLHEWTMQEYEQHDRHRRWYVFMGVVAALCILYALFTGNFLFALVIILFAVILYLQSHQHPPQVLFQITEAGIVLGNRFYAYKEFEAFYIIYIPPEVKSLYLETKSTTRPTLRIPLLDENPLSIRATLLQFLPEDTEKEEEPLSDKFAREWQLH